MLGELSVDLTYPHNPRYCVPGHYGFNRFPEDICSSVNQSTL